MRLVATALGAVLFAACARSAPRPPAAPEPPATPEASSPTSTVTPPPRPQVADPEKPRSIDELYRYSRGLWEQERYEEALTGFLEIALEHPGHDMAPFATELALDSLVILARFDELESLVDELLGRPRFVARWPEVAERLTRIKRAATRKRLERMSMEGRHAECGAGYLELFNSDPRSDTADEVLYNAGVCFEQAREVGKAVAVFLQLPKRLPRSQLSGKAMFRVAHLYESMAMFERAAEAYERFARREPGSKLGVAALETAITLRGVLGDDGAFAQVTELYIRLYGKRHVRSAASAFLALARVRGARAPAAMIHHLRAYLRRYANKGGAAPRIKAHLDLGHAMWSGACRRRAATATSGLCATRRNARASRQATTILARAIKNAERARQKREAIQTRWLERARLTLLDAEVEKAMHGKTASRLVLAERYRELAARLVTPWSVVALERRASLTASAQGSTKATKDAAYRACVDRAIALMAPQSWWSACDDAVFAVDPSLATPRERRGAPAIGEVVSHGEILTSRSAAKADAKR